MLAVEIHKLLNEIAKNTYPDEEILKFYIEIHSKESATRHGDYSPMQKKIRIFNLSRKTEYIVKTTIHELAHHCEFSLHGSTGHSKRFYKVYKDLLETSIKMGLITWDDIKDVDDSGDIQSLIRHFGHIDVQYDERLDAKKDLKRISIFNSYSIKSQLSQMGYKYTSYDQSWSKEFHYDDLESELGKLLTMTDKENIKVSNANQIELEAIYYIVVKGGYDIKEELKNRDYRYNGYNRKGKVWVKKIKANSLKEEEYFLRRNNLKFKVEGTK